MRKLKTSIDSAACQLQALVRQIVDDSLKEAVTQSQGDVPTPPLQIFVALSDPARACPEKWCGGARWLGRGFRPAPTHEPIFGMAPTIKHRDPTTLVRVCLTHRA